MKVKLLSARTLLWVAMLLALAGSLSHVTDTFQSINGDWALSFMQAVAIDVGCIALTIDVMVKRRRNEKAIWSWAGIVMFAVISVFANLRYGLSHTGQTGEVYGYVEVLKPYILAATLPLLGIYLSKILGGHITEDRKLAERDNLKELREANRQLQAKVEELKAPELTDTDKVLTYISSNPDATQEEVGAMLGKSRSTAGNILRSLIESNRVKRNGSGWEVPYAP